MNGNRWRLGAACLAVAASLAWTGCVEERCYLDEHCPAPKVCGPAGTCVWRCTTDPECGTGFVCRDHACVPGGPVDPDATGADLPPEAASPEPFCPEDMLLVERTFCVDRYEASRPDASATRAGVDGSRAVSRAGVIPWQVGGDNAAAQAACVAAGKRLCTPVEWEFACKGPADTTYGYGNGYNPLLCNGIDTYCDCDGACADKSPCPFAGCQNTCGATFRLEPTGSFPACTNGFGVFDMNGNLWEHVLDGSGRTVRGGAFNCADSRELHQCAYVPNNWTPSALGFRCCREPEWRLPGEDAVQDVAGPDLPLLDLTPADPGPADPGGADTPRENGCIDPDDGTPDPGVDPGVDPGTDPGTDPGIDPGIDPGADPGFIDPGNDPGFDPGFDPGADPGFDPGADPGFDPGTDPGTDPGIPPEPCPSDMVRIRPNLAQPGWCMDRYEASRADATSSSYGSSNLPSSRPGVLPWWGSGTDLVLVQAACESVGKRPCTLDEWLPACTGTANRTYVYGNAYVADACNGIDAFCYCGTGTACADVALCPFPHCRVGKDAACVETLGDAGKCGPCSAAFHVAPTGSFGACVNEWGARDICGNVWELVVGTDGLAHFRGGAYNCSDSEWLHRCDTDVLPNQVNAKGFRCCRDVTSP